jgi:hypothetical protein
MLRLALAAGLAMAVAGASFAAAQQSPEPAARTDPRAGIERAKAAGMRVDPAAEELMAQAPPGSCANDPTQATCPKAEAIVRAPIPARLVTPAELTAVSARAGAAKTTAKARAAQMPADRCSMFATAPFKEGGVMKGDGGAQCWGGDIQRMEFYGSLHKQYNGAWYQMDVDADAINGPGTAWAHPRYTCANSAYRYWFHRIELYVLWMNTWYADTFRAWAWKYCG